MDTDKIAEEVDEVALQKIKEQRDKFMRRILSAKPTPVSLNRISGTLRLYVEREGVAPLVIQGQFDNKIENDVQPYVRDLRVTGEWTELEFAWIPPGVVGTIIIENRAGVGLTTNPTPEEEEKLKNKFLYLSTDKTDQWIIRPKRFFIAERNDIPKLWIRADTPPVKAIVSIIAR